MIEIDGKPIMWHIMKHYASFGFKNFIICGGYKQEIIKKYFQDYFIDNGFTGDYTDANAKLDVLGYKAPVKNTAVFEVTTDTV